MATFYSGYSNQYRLRLEVTQKSQDVNNNTSTVSWALYLESGNRYYQQYGTRVNVSIGGETVHNSNVQRNVSGMNTSTLVESGTKTVSHNSDGTKKLSVYALLETNTKSSITPSSALVINSSMNLTTIARASKPTLSSRSVSFGSSVTIYTNRQSSKFTHKIIASLGDRSETIAENVSDSYQWTVPYYWMSLIPTSSSATITIYLQTFSGNTRIGITATSLTASIGSGSSGPSIGYISVSEDDYTVKDKLKGAVYVQGQSKLKVSFSASGRNGASVRSSSVTVEGKTYIGSSISTETIKGSGTLTITCRATDSRGTSSSRSATITVEPYSPPKINEFSVYRANSNGGYNKRGTYARANYKAVVTSLNNKNTIDYTLKYRIKGSSSWQSVSISQSNYVSDSYRVVPNISLQNTYDFTLVIEDLFSRAESTTGFGTGDITMDFKEGGKGVAFGKFSERDNTIESAWDIDINSKEPYLNLKPSGDYKGLRVGKQGNDNFYSINDYDGIGINIYTAGKLTHNQNEIANKKYVDDQVQSAKNLANSANNKIAQLPKIVTGQTKISNVSSRSVSYQTIYYSGFSSPPKVFVTNLSGAPNLYPTSVYYVSKSDATIYTYNGHSATVNIDIAWVAIGN